MNRRNHSIHIEYQTVDSLDDCVVEDRLLLNAARDQVYNAYAPYSRFRVGAALRLSNGLLFTGNNQENAAFPLGSCAERVVCGYAKALHPYENIEAIAVYVSPADFELDQAVSPCGGCRQLLLEYELNQNSPIKLIMQANESAIILVPSAAALLPLHFHGKLLRK